MNKSSTLLAAFRGFHSPMETIPQISPDSRHILPEHVPVSSFPP